MRGLAALSVAMFHFTQGNASLNLSAPMHALGSVGWAGVSAFFVISGFVVPLSADSTERGSAGRFLLRRLVRLTPPYWISLVFVLLLWWLSSLAPGFRGATGPIVTSDLVLCHLGYACGALGLGWWSPVYWSLAVEIVFYVAVALAVALDLRPTWRFVICFALGSCAVLPGSLHIPWLAPATLFALGHVLWLHHTGRLAGAALAGAYTVSLAAVALACGLVEALAAIAEVSAAQVSDLGSTILTALGRWSYSIYLLHVPIGGRVINLAARLQLEPWQGDLCVVAAVLASVAASALFYRTVERPCIDAARRWRVSRAVHASDMPARVAGHP